VSIEDSDTNNSRLRIIIVIVDLLSMVGGGIIAIIIAYLKRADARGTIWESHFTYAIRTLWGAFGVIVGFIIMMFFTFRHAAHGAMPNLGTHALMVAAVLLVSLWALIRSLNSLLRAIDNRPISNPRTLLI
jgi:uncharacterized membrane protein